MGRMSTDVTRSWLVGLAAGTMLLVTHVNEVPAGEDLPWQTYVTNCLDILIESGTDRYGPQHTAMLMSILDPATRQSPEDPLLLDTVAYYEEGRAHRRAIRGSNFWYDQATIRTMYRVSQMTGNTKYAEAADAYIDAVFKHAVKDNGLLVWGTHVFYDAYADRPGGDADGRGPHEILVYHPQWAELYRRNPEATRRAIDAIWEWHISDQATGQHNRHDDRGPGCDFAFSGGSFVLACASLYGETHEEKYLDRAKTIARWHWRHRDPTTGLIPDAPALTDRFDGTHCMTTVPGPFASQLLRSYELTGDVWLRDVAVDCIKAYDKYGYDQATQTYHGMLKLDGTPVAESAKGAGYDIWAPTGPVDVWKTTIYSYEFALVAAQSTVYAYELSGTEGSARDPQLLASTLRWAGYIERNLPPQTGRRWKAEIEAALPEVARRGGSYAEDYGRAISFFIHVYHATGEARFREIAENLAREAVEKLYVDGLFRSHPAKPYYEATQGVGLLLHALLELDLLPEKWNGAF
ncbi:MAG: glycoside hydrolase family protein [Pirellulaceae bacterium]